MVISNRTEFLIYKLTNKYNKGSLKLSLRNSLKQAILQYLQNNSINCLLFTEKIRFEKMLDWAAAEFQIEYGLETLPQLEINNMEIDNLRCNIDISGKMVHAKDGLKYYISIINYYWDDAFLLKLERAGTMDIARGNTCVICTLDCAKSEHFSYEPDTFLKDIDYFSNIKEFNLSTSYIGVELDKSWYTDNNDRLSARLDISKEIKTILLNALNKLEGLSKAKLTITIENNINSEITNHVSNRYVNKITIYKFLTEERKMPDRRINKVNLFRLCSVYNEVISIEIDNENNLEIYLDQYGLYYFEDLLEPWMESPLDEGMDDITLAFKGHNEECGYFPEILSPVLIGSANNRLIDMIKIYF